MSTQGEVKGRAAAYNTDEATTTPSHVTSLRPLLARAIRRPITRSERTVLQWYIKVRVGCGRLATAANASLPQLIRPSY
eukprot:1179810-Prorocentrum_minimum.AAC.3